MENTAKKPSVILAEHAGFCFGVQRATDRLEEALANALPGETVCTLGQLIHNEGYNERLKKQGVRMITEAEISELAKKASADHPVTILIRAHGCSREIQESLDQCVARNPFFRVLDCTCPYVKKIHKIAKENSSSENVFFLIGAANHPEVVGIMSYFEGEKYVFSSDEELFETLKNTPLGKITKKTPLMAAQTTLNLVNWEKSQQIIKNLYTNAVIFDTICSVTEQRQNEASSLSALCDGMIVIGGRESSNTAKLYQICKANCEKTIWITEAAALDTGAFEGAQKIGIVAGASTPRKEIEEVYQTMSEMNENFEQMLEEQCSTLNTGDVVIGTVTQVTDNELQLDLGTSVTGYIKADQISDDPALKLTETFKKGDKVEAFVIRVSDVEGVAELSKKRVDADRNWQNIVAACEEKTILEGRVAEAVRGGVVIFVDANRVFVPASQTGVPKEGDLNELVGTTVKFRVIEIKPQGKKAIGSIRQVLREEKRAQANEFWSSIEVGKTYEGTVRSLTSYGAFVDLGCGVDGMVHVSELSWKRISDPSKVVSVGDKINVFVKSFDPEKKRISLGYKTEADNPWNIFKARYAVGDVATVKIVNLQPFGAFAEIVDGVDGLIHISRISTKRIGNPGEVLEVGQSVDAKIVDIDDENHKVSLSIRALMEDEETEEQATEEAPVEETAAEEAPAEE
ncbi:MAG: bifunctional 4-hydroxy-3-methylbut-2-enyl diphosphate reductase/30S ribosomal protein S1 [Ruminococcaceae bacterium]|nr:bifunctional 4-hydroxy-3-methylbut-2-enyl diphosphate reductase/30S ribosomal protein S1 [Oscillospiraceae bacterium]